MDQPTLEYLSRNVGEFIGGVIGGAVVGSSSRVFIGDVLVNQPELSKLGCAALLGFANDPLQVGAGYLGMTSETSMMKAAQGDIGNIFGWYVGFHLGKAIHKGMNRVYRRRD
ncbi:hypothetical protein HY486_03075 [Candidatus Woesearchaeota archaeon]|nr:hypothetical protein [Candidatus Woesearchaeota archaeon]